MGAGRRRFSHLGMSPNRLSSSMQLALNLYKYEHHEMNAAAFVYIHIHTYIQLQSKRSSSREGMGVNHEKSWRDKTMSGWYAYMKFSKKNEGTKVEMKKEKKKRITPSEFPKIFFPSLSEKSFLPLQLTS